MGTVRASLSELAEDARAAVEDLIDDDRWGEDAYHVSTLQTEAVRPL